MHAPRPTSIRRPRARVRLGAALLLIAAAAGVVRPAPAAAQRGPWLFSAGVSVIPHGPPGNENPYRLEGGYSFTRGVDPTDIPADGVAQAQFFKGDGADPAGWTAYLFVGVTPPSIGFKAGDPATQFAGGEGQCRIEVTRRDATALQGLINCTGVPTLYPQPDNPTVDLSGSFAVFFSGTPSPGGGCTVEGVVTDRVGAPVSGIHVRLEDAEGAVQDDVGTATDGRYRFAPVEGRGPFRAVVVSEDWAHSPSWFQVFVGEGLGGIRSDPIDPAGGNCRRDFPVAALPGSYETFSTVGATAEEIIELYQEIEAGWRGTRSFEYSISDIPGLPLRVFAWCKPNAVPSGIACPDATAAAHFDAEGNNFQRPGYPPYIAIHGEYSRIKNGVTPAKTVLHEFGHFFQYAAFGGLVTYPGSEAHGGYYKNTSSSDSWIEGFATFYAEMVKKHVLGDRTSHYETMNSGPWDFAGKTEEFAIVAMLWDFEDATAEYPGPGDVPAASGDVWVDSSRTVFSARFPADVALGTRWTATATGPNGTASASGTIVEREGRRVAVGRVPKAGGPNESLSVVAHQNRPAGDDDPVPGNLPQLWRAIQDFRSEASWSNGHAFDVTDLYTLLRTRFAGDRDADGVEDADEIFITHGLHADVHERASNQRYDAGEQVGLTSHIGGQLGVTMDPRSSAPAVPELQAAVDTGGVAATALATVSFEGAESARSFTTEVAPGPDGRFDLGLPPGRSASRVSVIMLAPGHLPALALDLSGEEFWTRANASPGASFLSAAVTLVPGEIAFAGDGGGGSGGTVVALIALAIGLGMVGTGVALWIRRRRRAASGGVAAG